jgi:hypothetical protein
MPKRHEKDPLFGGRIAEVRVRLDYPERKAFADERLKINSNTYQAWEQLSVTPSMRDLKRAIKNIREPGTDRMLADWQALVIWLADGQDAPPAWLRNRKLDPFGAPVAGNDSPGGGGGSTPLAPAVPAIPVTLLIERIGSVAPVLRRAATRELQDAEGRGDLGVVEVATAFEKFYRELRAKIAKPPAPGQPAPGPAGGAFESGSNLLRWIEREVDAA